MFLARLSPQPNRRIVTDELAVGNGLAAAPPCAECKRVPRNAGKSQTDDKRGRKCGSIRASGRKLTTSDAGTNAILWANLGAVAQWKSTSFIREGPMDRSHPALPDRHRAGVAQRQSNRLLIGRPRYRNSPPAPTSQYGPLAQLAERRFYTAKVRGSKPRGSTIARLAESADARR